jgi:tRNA(Ile)-lysidine synthase
VLGYLPAVAPTLPSLSALRASVAAWPRLAVGRLDPVEPLGVAVSGGADSIYLLLALWADAALRPWLRVWHFNHRVRGADAAADARFVQDLCTLLAVPCVVGVRAAEGLASEAELRAARLAFFAEQRVAQGVRVVATAHHLDDVVESMLMRLARGAGLAGLAAPRGWQVFRDGHVHWRPLIEARLTKAQLLAALTAAGLPWREDATNLQPIAQRNRVRAWLGQGGAEALGETFAQGFGASARHLDEAQAALWAWADELGAGVQSDGSLATAALRGRPTALAHAALARFLAAHGLSAASGVSVDALVQALAAGRDTQATLLARRVVHQAGRLSLPPEAPVAFGPELRTLRPGHLDEESGLRAEWVDVDADLWAKLSRGEIAADAVAYLNVPLDATLAWRGRVEGDRYQPLGAAGSTKLSDLLINRKIPAERRESLPVVLVDNTITWVPGQPPAHAARLVGPQKGALRLTWLGPCLSSDLPR